jgi:hypothetical protein
LTIRPWVKKIVLKIPNEIYFMGIFNTKIVAFGGAEPPVFPILVLPTAKWLQL